MILPNDPDVHQDDTDGTINGADALPRADNLPYRPYDRRDAPPVCDGEPDVIADDNLARVPRYSTEGLSSPTLTGDTDGALDPR